MTIISRQNSHFKRWHSLLESKGIKKEKMFFLMGSKLISEFLKRPSLKILCELRPQGKASLFEKIQSEKSQEILIKSYELSYDLFSELDILGTHYNILVLELPDLPHWKSTHPIQGLEVITPLGDPSNLGALIRSCCAFGVQKIILASEAAHPFLPKSIKASAGAVLYSPLYLGPSLAEVKESAESQFPLIFLDMKGKPIQEFKWPLNTRLVLGEEGPGLRLGRRGETDNSSYHLIRIETQGVESLNATVAASIAIFSYSSQHKII